jgi:hypothetical protein
MEAFLEAVFSMRSMPRLYNEDTSRVDRKLWVGTHTWCLDVSMELERSPVLETATKQGLVKP